MESNIQLFNNQEFGHVNVILDDDGNPWFVGKEIAVVLGYKDPNHAILDHVKEKNRKLLKYRDGVKTPLSELWANNDFRDKWLVNEFGLYSLIMGSKLESAEKFKDWVYEEVLPSIRKTGSYSLPQPQEDPDILIAKALILAKDKIDVLETKLIEMTDKYENEAECYQKLDEWSGVEIQKRDDKIEELSQELREVRKKYLDVICLNSHDYLRSIIRAIVIRGHGRSIQERWSFLYDQYNIFTHQNIFAQNAFKEYKKTTLDYVCDYLKDTETLFLVCMYLYEDAARGYFQKFANFSKNSPDEIPCDKYHRKK